MSELATLFFLFLACALAALVCLVPFQRSAFHAIPSGSELCQIFRTIFFQGPEESELTSKVKSVKRSSGVILCIFFWGITASLTANFFDDQANMMSKPFEWWSSTYMQLFDGPPQIIFAPVTLGIKRFLESKGYVITHQHIIFVGLLSGIMTFFVLSVLQFFLSSGHEMSQLAQIPLWILNDLTEALVYATGLDFAFSSAHESMKTLILSFFYCAIGFGTIAGGFIFLFFELTLPFKEGMNPFYQALTFLGVTIVNAVVFYVFADWTPLKNEETESCNDEV